MGDKPNIEVEIAQIARRQYRNVARGQLLGLGMAASSIDYWVKIGRLYRVHRAVYSVGCPAVTPHEHAMAAVLACGPGAVLSHGSALSLWGIWKRWDRPFEVIVRGDRRPKGIKVHRQKLDRRDVTRQFGIAVTTLERALLDMAPHMSRKSLNRAMNDGRHDGHVQLDGLAEVIERYPNHAGTAPLAYCVGIAPKRPTRSEPEDDFPAFCKRYGLPRPELNVEVCGHEVDALFRDEKVIVELDSWEFHSSRTSFESDRDRDAVTLAGGFATVRITAERRREDPNGEAARLQTILARRRNYTAPPWPASAPTLM